MASTSRTIKVKFDGDAKDLARATKAAEKVVGDFGDKGGRKFTSSFKKWMSTGGLNEMRKSGEFGGQVFGSGLLGALKTPVIGPILTAAFGAAVLTVMPAVGAIAGGALVTGFGAGLAGLGLMFAAKNAEVKAVWEDTMSDLGRDMELLAEPFEDTLINIAGFFRRTVDAFNPHLAKAFSKMAGPIEDFADDAAHALEELIPAIDPITDAFNGVLGALGPALRSAVGDLSDGMVDLANSVKQNPQALADLVAGVGTLTRQTLGLITTLNDINTDFSDLTGGLSLVDVSIGAVTGGIAGLTASFGLLHGIMSGVNAVTSDGTIKAGSLADASKRVADAAKGTGVAAKHAATPVQTLTQKWQAQDRAIESVISAMTRWTARALGLSGAQIGLEAAVDDATASIKDNGRTLDINTEKGRANRTALNQIASAANAQTEAMLRSGRGNNAAAATAATSRQRFSELAQKMGLSKAQADALARSLIAIPNVTRTVRTRFITERIIRDQTGGSGGHAPGFASGGIARGTFWVGEQGRELMTLLGNGAARITPHGESERIAASAAAKPGPAEAPPGDTHVYVTIDGQQLEGRITRVVKDRDRKTKRAVGSGASRGAPA